MTIESTKYGQLSCTEKQPSRMSYESSSTLADLDDLDDLDYLSGSDCTRKTSRFLNLPSPSLRSHGIWLVHLVLLLTSFALFALAYTLRSSTLKHVQDFSAWSPAAGAVRYDAVTYNVTTTDNRFVGFGPEVDEAWRMISYDMGDQWVPKSALSKLGESSSLVVDHPRTGKEGYRVGMEVFHQLHCINLLRRVTYKEYYAPLGGEFGKGQEALQKHTDHCLEILRLNIQCNADVGLFTFYIVEGDPLAWPQLNSKHVCRNFEGVRLGAGQFRGEHGSARVTLGGSR
jgi:Mycotoxin biosynthesis protein UstYa